MEQHIKILAVRAGIIGSAMKKQHEYNMKRWDLCWIVNGKCKEVLMRNVTRAVGNWEKKKKENSTHKMGKLVLIEHGTHNY